MKSGSVDSLNIQISTHWEYEKLLRFKGKKRRVKASSLQTSFLLNSRPLNCLNCYSNFDCRFASSYSFSILRHCSEICALPRDTLIKGFLALRFFVIMLGITLFLDIYYDRPHTYCSLSNRLPTRRHSLYCTF